VGKETTTASSEERVSGFGFRVSDFRGLGFRV